MGTTISRKAVLAEVKEAFGLVPRWIETIPDAALAPFWATMRDVEMAETVLPNKTKELIGIAVSGATRCRYCTLFHTEGARLNGATEAEIAEAAFMGGVTMLGSTYLNAMQVDYDTFKTETLQIIKNVKAKAAAQAKAAPDLHAPH